MKNTTALLPTHYTHTKEWKLPALQHSNKRNNIADRSGDVAGIPPTDRHRYTFLTRGRPPKPRCFSRIRDILQCGDDNVRHGNNNERRDNTLQHHQTTIGPGRMLLNSERYGWSVPLPRRSLQGGTRGNDFTIATWRTCCERHKPTWYYGETLTVSSTKRTQPDNITTAERCLNCARIRATRHTATPPRTMRIYRLLTEGSDQNRSKIRITGTVR